MNNLFNINFYVQSNCSMTKVYLVPLLVLACLAHSTIAKRRKGGLDVTREDDSRWHGRWFPNDPNQSRTVFKTSLEKPQPCDNGLNGIDIDFSPTNIQQNWHYLCITNNHSAFAPNKQTAPVLTEQFIPKAYQPLAKCFNQSISYDAAIPTYGFYRPLPPKYCTYAYLPPQRWVHALAEGAIVFLYHPCTNNAQRLILENLVKNCLYRHIVSASNNLTAERPFALLAWGKKLELSVVDEHIIIEFVKKYAKQGPLQPQEDDGQMLFYETALLEEAHLLTNLQDTQICSFDNLEM